ncbi:hypothetical protein [Methylobacterium aquaticum]|nr:hypothetical protein [Methylobacterium aquaticum]
MQHVVISTRGIENPANLQGARLGMEDAAANASVPQRGKKAGQAPG